MALEKSVPLDVVLGFAERRLLLPMSPSSDFLTPVEVTASSAFFVLFLSFGSSASHDFSEVSMDVHNSVVYSVGDVETVS